MTFPKLLLYCGIILIGYALISGLRFYLRVDDDVAQMNSSYTLKIGLLICGAVMIYLGNRLKNE